MASVEDRKLTKARKAGYGIGLLKGMAVTLKHLFKHNTVIQYPDEKQDLPARTRGVIALKEENCTVCMLCARECPDWCIYIDSHKEQLPPKREGGRPRKRNVLDRFAIDYALCMYCGICVEVCPYDALFWSREFEYSEYDIRELTHEKEKLSDWMATVLPPPELEVGGEIPGQSPTAAPAPAAPATAAPPEAQATTSQAEAGETKTTQPEGRAQATEEKAPAGEAKPEAAPSEDKAKATTEPEREPSTEAPAQSAEEKAKYQESPGPNVEIPHEAPHPVALERTEDPDAVYKEVLQQQLDKGSSPQVAEARAKVARVKAERGIRRGPTPIETEKMVPSAPTKGQPAPPEPSGAPEAQEPKPEQGPVEPTQTEASDAPRGAGGAAELAPDTSPSSPPAAEADSADPDAVFERVLAEEKAKGSSEAVAQGRAKAARVKAERAKKAGS